MDIIGDIADLVHKKLVKPNQTKPENKQTQKEQSLHTDTIRIQTYCNILSEVLSIQQNIMQSHTEEQKSITHTRRKAGIANDL